MNNFKVFENNFGLLPVFRTKVLVYNNWIGFLSDLGITTFLNVVVGNFAPRVELVALNNELILLTLEPLLNPETPEIPEPDNLLVLNIGLLFEIVIT